MSKTKVIEMATEQGSVLIEAWDVAPKAAPPVVMDFEDGIGQPIHVPDGWDLLPGGVERTIGVNRGWIEDGEGAPWRIEVAGQRIESVAEFVPYGPVKSAATETIRAARLVTSGPILVRR